MCAAGANDSRKRELDNVVLEQAAFVSPRLAGTGAHRVGRPDRPVQAGACSTGSRCRLHEVVSGDLQGRQSDDDIVVFKSNRLAAWDVAIGAAALDRARERGVETTV